MSTAPNTASFAVSLALILDESGNVDWDASLEAVKETVDTAATESKTIREDVLKVLQKFPMEFINEDIVVDKVVARRGQQKASSLRATDETYTDDTFDYSLAELAEMRSKVSGFIAANKPQENDNSNSSLLLSVRGRGGGVQLRSNASVILSKRESEKGSKKL